jgi:hypothetical protein
LAYRRYSPASVRAYAFGLLHFADRLAGNVAELISVPTGQLGRPSKALTLEQALP